MVILGVLVDALFAKLNIEDKPGPKKKCGKGGSKIDSHGAPKYKHNDMSVLPAQFDASLVTFGEIKALQSGAKAVNLSYDGRPLIMQVSNLDVPYGLNTEDKYGPTKYSLNLSLRDFESNPKTKSVFEALQALDDSVTSECIEKNWLRKPGMTQQILKQMKLYKPTVKFSEDENGNRKPYPPTVKIALRKKNDKFETVFYDQDKKEIKDVPIEDMIVKRMTVTALIECTGVWISSVGCGLSWKAKQVKVVSRPDGVGRGYGFVDEDESPTRGSVSATRPDTQSKNNFADAFDDDEEVDDETVTAVLAAPVEEAPAPKKTIIKKKVVGGAKA